MKNKKNEPKVICYAIITHKNFPDLESIAPIYEGIDLADYKTDMETSLKCTVTFVDDISEEDKRDLDKIQGSGIFIKNA